MYLSLYYEVFSMVTHIFVPFFSIKNVFTKRVTFSITVSKNTFMLQKRLYNTFKTTDATTFTNTILESPYKVIHHQKYPEIA